MRTRIWLAIAAWLAACTPAATPAAPAPLPTVQVVQATYTPGPRLTNTPAATHTLPASVTAATAPSATPEPPTPSPTQALPTPDAAALGREVRLPILMYHYVEPWPEDAGEIRRNLTVRPEDFAAQMNYLHERGYVTVSLYDLIYALSLGQPLPERAVVLTFDDGYRTLMEYAAPVMEPLGYTGVVFVVTELMDRDFPAYLTWPQAEALYARGWKIEPHTKTHEQLQGRDRDFQLYQMLGSAQTVAAHIGVQPRFFNYPAGQYDQVSLQLARELDLWGAVTVDFGRVHTLDERYTLGRVRISGQMTLAEFAAALGE